jgi:hypothetical protein
VCVVTVPNEGVSREDVGEVTVAQSNSSGVSARVLSSMGGDVADGLCRLHPKDAKGGEHEFDDGTSGETRTAVVGAAEAVAVDTVNEADSVDSDKAVVEVAMMCVAGYEESSERGTEVDDDETAGEEGTEDDVGDVTREMGEADPG